MFCVVNFFCIELIGVRDISSLLCGLFFSV